MSELAQQWLDVQQAKGRVLVLCIDRQVEPDPIARLFAADLMDDYVSLYLNTEVADLADIGPWLIRLTHPDAPLMQELLSAPEQNWGWIGSLDAPELETVAKHWRARLLIKEDSGPSLFRFQDNRVMARCLAALEEEDRPLLLGPIISTLYWDEARWVISNNPNPGNYRAPVPAPWLQASEPQHIGRGILRENLLQWALQFHPDATLRVAETRSVKAWLDEQITLAERWQWRQPEQLVLLLTHRLHYPPADDELEWNPLPGEEPQSHFVRYQQLYALKETPT